MNSIAMLRSRAAGDPKKSYKALVEGGNRGFAALLGGWRRPSDSSFNYLGVYGNYWSGTEKDTQSAWRYHFSSSYGELYRDDSGKSYGFSCRCLQD